MSKFGEIINPPSFGEDEDEHWPCLCYVYSEVDIRIEDPGKGKELLMELWFRVVLCCKTPKDAEPIEEFTFSPPVMELHTKKYKVCGDNGNTKCESLYAFAPSRCDPGYEYWVAANLGGPGLFDNLGEKQVCITGACRGPKNGGELIPGGHKRGEKAWMCWPPDGWDYKGGMHGTGSGPLAGAGPPSPRIAGLVEDLWDLRNNLKKNESAIKNILGGIVHNFSRCPIEYPPCERKDQGAGGGLTGMWQKGWDANEWCRFKKKKDD